MALLGAGTAFGKYAIIRLIGRGGMGVVYLAEDTTLGRRVALKILDRGITSGDGFEQRFRQEARTIASLQHPNIIQIHALERVNHDLAIDMPFVEGGSLADIAPGGIALPRMVRLAHDILLALACCHEAEIVHRDIKPSNILIGTDGRALVSDFGLAKLLVDHQRHSIRESSSSGFFMGTPRYAPPESWDGQSPTPAWDVYSVGMVLYEAAAGAPPYDADTPLALVKQLFERTIPRLQQVRPETSGELSDLVASMLSHDPAARPQDAGLVLDILRHVPELNAGTDADATLIRRHPCGNSRTRGKKREWGRWVRNGVAAALGAAALLGMWAATYVYVRQSTGIAPSAIPTDAATARAVPAAAPAGVIYDSVEGESQQVTPQHCLIEPGTRPGEWRAFAWESFRLWQFQLEATDGDGLSVTGNWAAYADDSACVFKYGTLQGTGHWLKPDEQLSLALAFTSAQDGSRTPQLLVLRASSPQETPTAFVNRFERSDYGQAILYNELVPRGTTWTVEVERDFLGAAAGILMVPHMGGAAITIDGSLDEPAWQTFAVPGTADTGVMPSRQNSGHVFVHYDDTAFYVGFRMAKPSTEPRVALALLNHFYIPLSQSPRWLVQGGPRGIELRRSTRSGPEEAWGAPLEFAATTTSHGWEAEIRLPYSNFEGVAAPTQGTRWRMNCSVSGAPGADAQPQHWGSNDLKAAEHGMLLIFKERP